MVCLGVKHAESALEGAGCPHCERLPLRTLCSPRTLFEEGVFASDPHGAGPAEAEAERQLHSWGSQLDLAEGMETGGSLSLSSPARSAARSLGSEARSAVSSSQMAGSAFHISPSEEEDVESADYSPIQSPQYEELLEVITDLESFWPGTGGSVCDSSDIALSPLVLSDSSSSAEAGCYGTDVAEASSVRFSPDRSAPGSSGESAPGRGPAVASSPVLAGPSMVLGPDFSPRRLSMGDSNQEGSPLTGGGYDSSPPPGVMEAVGVAPEGAQLIASGLSTEVVETILQSRAPSTGNCIASSGDSSLLGVETTSSTQLTARSVQYWSFCRLGSPQGYPTPP